MSSDSEGEDRTALEERFIHQHSLHPSLPTVRLARGLLPALAGPPRPPPRSAPTMTPWSHTQFSAPEPPGWPGFSAGWADPSASRQFYPGFQPPVFPSAFPPSAHAPQLSAFHRPGVAANQREQLLARAVAPGGPAGSRTLITHAAPEPGELTIEKTEPWCPSPSPGPSHVPGPSHAQQFLPSRPTAPPSATVTSQQAGSRPGPSSAPGRRVRLRDIMSGAVRAALRNPELDAEAERFNSEIGATFVSALGTTVKQEK